MPFDKEDLLRHYGETRAGLLAAIDGLSEEQMSEPTIDGWSVKDHLLHIALWDEERALEVERISAGFDSVFRMTAEQDGAYNDIGYELRRHLSPAQAKWEAETTRKKLLDAIRMATPRGLDEALYGEAALRSAHEVEHTGWIMRWRGEKGY